MNQSIEKILLDNEYCTIVDKDGEWFRIDKASGHRMEVDYYFSRKGFLITRKDKAEAWWSELSSEEKILYKETHYPFMVGALLDCHIRAMYRQYVG